MSRTEWSTEVEHPTQKTRASQSAVSGCSSHLGCVTQITEPVCVGNLMRLRYSRVLCILDEFNLRFTSMGVDDALVTSSSNAFSHFNQLSSLPLWVTHRACGQARMSNPFRSVTPIHASVQQGRGCHQPEVI
jgi:hypothetical protein